MVAVNSDFTNFGLEPALLKAIYDMGFEKPTDVQKIVLPIALADKDVVVQAQTGTGKTAAFGIPIIEKVSAKIKDIQALILTPTRELAIQVAADIAKLGRYKGLRSVAIYGGQAVEAQKKVLTQRIQIIIATPGRILDHMERGNIDLTNIRMLVLDEADEMFNLGLIAEVKTIINALSPVRQTMMFSATISDIVKEMAEFHTMLPEYISLTPKQLTAQKVEQWCCAIEENKKHEALLTLLANKALDSILVFCRTRKKVESVARKVNSAGYSALGLSGNLPQKQRLEILQRFKSGECKLLIATDVAARGLDIPRVSLVVNYDIPLYAETYVHRIGRTGRANHAGSAIVFFTEEELGYLTKIEAYIGYTLDRKNIANCGDLFNHNSETSDCSEECLAPDARKTNEIMRLFIGAGRKNKLRAGDIVGAITGATELTGEIIGVIEIYDTYSFVDILGGNGETVLKKLQNATIKGRRIKIEQAK